MTRRTTQGALRIPPTHPSYPHGLRDHSSTSHRPKLLLRSATTITNNGSGYDYEDDDAEEEEEGDNYEDDDDPPQQQQQKRHLRPRTTRQPDHEDDDVEDDGEEDPREGSRDYARRPNKLNYEFAPRAAAAAITKPKQSPSAHQKPAPAEWTAEATDVLLEVWGNRFLELGRKSLCSDEWVDVAKMVSAITKTHITDTQCRNRLDTLKKYKKEKMKLAESSGGGSGSSRWVYFTRMESLLSSSSLSQPPPQQSRQQLACGLDAGEYVFSNSRAYMNQPNGVDKIRDSTESDSGNDQEAEDDDDGDSDFPPPTKVRRTSASGRTAEEEDEEAASFRMLSESIQKFGEIYEKVKNSKRQQMMELEKMRMEFQRELEMQKRQILERAQEEIERIQKEDDDVDTAVTNVSG